MTAMKDSMPGPSFERVPIARRLYQSRSAPDTYPELAADDREASSLGCQRRETSSI